MDLPKIYRNGNGVHTQSYLNMRDDNVSFQKVLDYAGGLKTFIGLHQMTKP